MSLTLTKSAKARFVINNGIFCVERLGSTLFCEIDLWKPAAYFICSDNDLYDDSCSLMNSFHVYNGVDSQTISLIRYF